jgi:hypothetical protein
MTEPCGIDVLVDFYMGARSDFHKRKDHDLSIHLKKLREGKETWKARHFALSRPAAERAKIGQSDCGAPGSIKKSCCYSI